MYVFQKKKRNVGQRRREEGDALAARNRYAFSARPGIWYWRRVIRTRILLAEKMKYEKKRWTERARNRSTPGTVPALSLTPFSVCPRLGRRPQTPFKYRQQNRSKCLFTTSGKRAVTSIRETRAKTSQMRRPSLARPDQCHPADERKIKCLGRFVFSFFSFSQDDSAARLIHSHCWCKRTTEWRHFPSP